MTGAEIVLRALKDQGVDVIFGYPGGVTLSLYDEIYKQNHIRHYLCRHEQGCVHAAEGYARSTGKTGVALVTSGPGATNTITGLANAMMDSTPLVCFTGQVSTSMIGNDSFQEADTTGITRSCTKHNYLVKKTEDLARIIHEAFHVAGKGRPGPVVIDLPKDVIIGHGEYIGPEQVIHKTYQPKVKGDMARIREAVAMIAGAERPILYAGGGVINSGPDASKLLAEFAHMTGLPCTLTLMGLGAFPASDKQFLGMLGMHGTYEANMAMHQSDLIVCVGARFDDRITGRLDKFAPYAKKIHIDIDPSSINKSVIVDIPIVGDVAHVLEDMIKVWESTKAKIDGTALKNWWKAIDGWRARNCLGYKKNNDLPRPQYVLDRLNKLLKDQNAYVTTDVGQHQMWAAQYLGFDKPKRLVTSGGLGTMGFGLPAALGVQVAHPDAQVIVITSDASIQMNIQELATATAYGLPIKIVCLNNVALGMVRQWQELFFDKRYSQTLFDRQPDFVKLVEAYGGKGIRVEKAKDVDGALQAMLDHDGLLFLDIRTEQKENVFPMIVVGAAHNEMIFNSEESESTGADEDVVLA